VLDVVGFAVVVESRELLVLLEDSVTCGVEILVANVNLDDELLLVKVVLREDVEIFDVVVDKTTEMDFVLVLGRFELIMAELFLLVLATFEIDKDFIELLTDFEVGGIEVITLLLEIVVDPLAVVTVRLVVELLNGFEVGDIVVAVLLLLIVVVPLLVVALVLGTFTLMTGLELFELVIDLIMVEAVVNDVLTVVDTDNLVRVVEALLVDLLNEVLLVVTNLIGDEGVFPVESDFKVVWNRLVFCVIEATDGKPDDLMLVLVDSLALVLFTCD